MQDEIKRFELVVSKIDTKAEFFFIKPDLSQFSDFPPFFYDSVLNYSRVLLPLVLDVERVIYTDVDILHIKDISSFWAIDLKDKALGAVRDITVNNLGNDIKDCEVFNIDPQEPYFNNGLMLMNLSRFREKSYSQKITEFIIKYPHLCRFHEQSAMNIILHDEILLLDPSFNALLTFNCDYEERFMAIEGMNSNLHFITSFKPWLFYNEDLPNLMYYSLIDKLSLELNAPSFLLSKGKFARNKRIASLLPCWFLLKGFIMHTIGNKDSAARSFRVGEFWKEKIKYFHFMNMNTHRIQTVLEKWQHQIDKRLIN